MLITRVYIKDVFVRMFHLFGLETRTCTSVNVDHHIVKMMNM